MWLIHPYESVHGSLLIQLHPSVEVELNMICVILRVAQETIFPKDLGSSFWYPTGVKMIPGVRQSLESWTREGIVGRKEAGLVEVSE